MKFRILIPLMTAVVVVGCSKSSDDPQAGNVLVNENNILTQSLDKGSDTLVTMQYNPRLTVPEKFIQSKITCLSETLTVDENTGVGLMPGSKVIVKNQMDPMQIQQKPYTRVVCNSNADPIQSMDANLIETIELSTSRVEPIAVYVGTQKSGISRSGFFYVSCSANEDDFITENYNGVGLITGSSLMVVRDLGYQFKDGSTQSEELPYILIKCR